LANKSVQIRINQILEKTHTLSDNNNVDDNDDNIMMERHYTGLV